MEIHEREVPWIKRIEELIGILEGSTISELELTEAGTEIIIRRQPGMVMVSAPVNVGGAMNWPHTGQAGIQVSPGATGRTVQGERGATILAPMTGIYYATPSPASPPFVSIGDVVQVGQAIALIEAMKVFNEVQAEISGRVVELVAQNGEVVQKGDVLIRVEPL
jgi:acetyl-CoA carboxylase biotin carboxyl carrier protein